MSMEHIEIRVDYASKIVELGKSRRESPLQVLSGIVLTSPQTLIERMQEGQQYFKKPTTEDVSMDFAVCRDTYEYIRTVAHRFNYNVAEFVTRILAVPRTRILEYLDGDGGGIETEIELDVRATTAEVEAVAEQLRTRLSELSLSHSDFVDVTIRAFTNLSDGNWQAISKVKSSWPNWNWYQRNQYQRNRPNAPRPINIWPFSGEDVTRCRGHESSVANRWESSRVFSTDSP